MKLVLLSILSGLLFAVSWPTYGFPLFLFVAFIPLLWVEYQIRISTTTYKKTKIFFASYLTFLIFNSATTWWLYYATPFGMFFAILANTALMSLVILFYHLIAKKVDKKLSLVALICLWICFEKFHLNWEFSWPWLNLGNGFASYYKWIQWYEYTGVFGGTLWILFINTYLFSGLIIFVENQHKKQFIKRIISGLSIISIGIFLSLYLYETYIENSAKKVDIIVLQPNLDPYSEKYTTTNTKIAQDLIDLATPKLNEKVDFVIAPETTLPEPRLISNFNQSPEFLLLSNFAEKNPNTGLLIGITFFEVHNASEKRNSTANSYANSNDWYNIYNSSFYLQKNNPLEIYHKSKLVVGVEHMPYRAVLSSILENSMIDLGGEVSTLTTQKNRVVFNNKNHKIAPIICYESIYGEFVTDYVNKGADVLAIITNDGWWNNSQGHKQHLSMARLRAIENRRAIARSANTGISAGINQRGDLLKSIPYEEKGSVKVTLNTNAKITFYTKHGDYIYRISAFILVILLLISFTRRRQNSF